MKCRVYVSCFIYGRKYEDYSFAKNIELDFLPFIGMKFNIGTEINLSYANIKEPVVESMYYSMKENEVVITLSPIKVPDYRAHSMLMDKLRKNGWRQLV
jgi:hypothetical protein